MKYINLFIFDKILYLIKHDNNYTNYIMLLIYNFLESLNKKVYQCCKITSKLKTLSQTS